MSLAAAAPMAPLPEAEESLHSVVPAPLRADLVMQRQLFRGNEYYVIKDPLALTYFRLQHEEGYLITLLDGKRTIRQIHGLFQERFPNAELTSKDVVNFINQMGAAGLLNINARRFVVNARAQESVRVSWFQLWGKILSGLLFMRFPLVDPSPWLGRLTHAIRFIWTRWFIGLCLAFITWTVFWLVVNRAAFSQSTINFFSPENLFLVWVTIIIVKTLHEFGHATTCRHFGAEVHEMGVCLICFAPAGYVDASDAWMMRRKAHKLYTTMAGVFTEFVIAGIAAHLWLYLPPGLAKNLAFNAMIVASVNTVFFNANPLMKFDGYYVVSDLLEIPNLRTKSMTYCSYHLQRWLLGYRNLLQESSLGDERHNRVFIIYSVLAYAYMVMIIYSLTQVFAHLLAPYGLRDFGLGLGIFVQASFLMFPIFKVMSDAFAAGRLNTVREENAWLRVSRWLVPLLILGIGLAFVPSHYRVRQQGVVVASQSERAAIQVGGVVEKVHVQPGQWVEAGQLLLTLRNETAEADAKIAELQFNSARIGLAALQMEGDLQSMGSAPGAAAGLAAAQSALERAERTRGHLQVRATSAGFVMTPDIDRFLGRYLAPGYGGVRIADLREFRLLIPLTEAQADLVEVGSPVRGYSRADATRLDGKIVVLPSQKAGWEDYHPAMLSAFGGPAPYEPASAMERIPPAFGVFIAQAEFVDPPKTMIEDLRVKVTIMGQKATYGQRMWRWLISLWRSRTLT